MIYFSTLPSSFSELDYSKSAHKIEILSKYKRCKVRFFPGKKMEHFIPILTSNLKRWVLKIFVFNSKMFAVICFTCHLLCLSNFIRSSIMFCVFGFENWLGLMFKNRKRRFGSLERFPYKWFPWLFTLRSDI